MVSAAGAQEVGILHSIAMHLVNLAVAAIWFFAIVKRDEYGKFRLRAENLFETIQLEERQSMGLVAIVAILSYSFAYDLTSELFGIFLPFELGPFIFFQAAEPVKAGIVILFSAAVILSVLYRYFWSNSSPAKNAFQI